MKLQDLKKLQQRKFRESFGRFLIEGEHLVLELQKAVARHPALQASELYVTHEYEHWRSPFKTQVIGTRDMSEISDTQNPQGILALVPLLPVAPPAARERAVYLYEIQDPGNLGTILRSLAWFGDYRCLLSPGSVDLYNSKVIRASMGAIFHLPIQTDVALDSLPQRYARIACLDMQGRSIDSPDFKSCDCYVFGNEARGLPREKLGGIGAQSFTITGRGAIESLNVAAALNMCAYEISR